MTDLLTTLAQKLDENTARYTDLDAYYGGTQPLIFLSPEAKLALGSRFGRMASNIPRLAVTAMAERSASPASPAPTCGRTGSPRTWTNCPGSPTARR